MTLKSDCESPSECSNGEENPSWQLDGSSNSNGGEDSSWRLPNSPRSNDAAAPTTASSAVPRGSGVSSAGGEGVWDITAAASSATEGNNAQSTPRVPEPVDVTALSGKSGDVKHKSKSGTASKQRGVFEKRKRPSKEEEKKKPAKPKEKTVYNDAHDPNVWTPTSPIAKVSSRKTLEKNLVEKQAGSLTGWPSDGKVIQRWTTPAGSRFAGLTASRQPQGAAGTTQPPDSQWGQSSSQTTNAGAPRGSRAGSASEWDEESPSRPRSRGWNRGHTVAATAVAAAATQGASATWTSGEDWDSHGTAATSSGGWISQSGEGWSPEKYEDDSVSKGGREIYDEWMAETKQDYPTMNLLVRKKTRRGLIDPFEGMNKWEASDAATNKPKKGKSRGKSKEKVPISAPSAAAPPGRPLDVSPSSKFPRQKSSAASRASDDRRTSGGPPSASQDLPGGAVRKIGQRSPRGSVRVAADPSAVGADTTKEAEASAALSAPEPSGIDVTALASTGLSSLAHAAPIAQQTPPANPANPLNQLLQAQAEALQQAFASQLLNQALASQMTNLGGGVPGLVSPLLNPLLSTQSLADTLLLSYHWEQIQQLLKRSNAPSLPQMAANTQSAAAAASILSPQQNATTNASLLANSPNHSGSSLLANPLLMGLMQPLLLAQGLSSLSLQQSQQGALAHPLLQQQQQVGAAQISPPQPVVSEKPPVPPQASSPTPASPEYRPPRSQRGQSSQHPHSSRHDQSQHPASHKSTPGVAEIRSPDQSDSTATSASSNDASSSSPTEIPSSPTSFHYNNNDRTQSTPQQRPVPGPSGCWMPAVQQPGARPKTTSSSDPWPAAAAAQDPNQAKSFGRGQAMMTIPDGQSPLLEAGSNSPRTPVGWVSSTDALRDQSNNKTDLFHFSKNTATDESSDGWHKKDPKANPDYSVVPEAEWGGTVLDWSERDTIFDKIPGFLSLSEIQKNRAYKYLTDPNCNNTECSNPLHQAIQQLISLRKSRRKGHHHLYTRIREIIRAGDIADAIDECCRTPLYIAVKYGDVELATMLLEEGKANPDLLSLSKDYVDGDAPILLATSLGDTVMVELLIRYRANRAITASKGNSCLHIAVKKPDRDYNKEMVRLLLQAEGVPSVDEILNVNDFQGDKPIHAAVYAGHVSAIELMIRQGRGDINTRNGKGETPLIRAIHRDMISKNLMFCLLKNVKADPNIPDLNGNFPLHLAISNQPKVSNNWLINRLVLAGADPNIIDGNGQQKGYSPLLTAVSANYPFAADRLLDAGADPDIGDCWGNTPLFHLINLSVFPPENASGRSRIPRHRNSRQPMDPFPLVLLLNGGASIHKIIPKESHSAFHKVILEGQMDFLMMFLRYDSNMAHCDENGLTPMDLAIKSQRLESIVVLLLAEYPIDRKQIRRIDDYIVNIEPRVMESLYTCLVKEQRRGDNDDLLNVSVTNSVSQILREIDSKQLEDTEDGGEEGCAAGGAAGGAAVVMCASLGEDATTDGGRTGRSSNDGASRGDDEYSSEVRWGMELPATGDQVLRVLKWRAGAVRWVKQELSNPLSLKRLCRRSIRQRVLTIEEVCDLPLPQGLKEFLYFGFLRDDFKSLVKSAPRTKDLHDMFSRSKTVVEDDAIESLDDVGFNVNTVDVGVDMGFMGEVDGLDTVVIDFIGEVDNWQ